MAQPQTAPSSDGKRQYRCRYNTAQPNPEYVDETKTPGIPRGVMVPPGTVLHLTAHEALVLERQHAVTLVTD